MKKSLHRKLGIALSMATLLLGGLAVAPASAATSDVGITPLGRSCAHAGQTVHLFVDSSGSGEVGVVWINPSGSARVGTGRQMVDTGRQAIGGYGATGSDGVQVNSVIAQCHGV